MITPNIIHLTEFVQYLREIQNIPVIIWDFSVKFILCLMVTVLFLITELHLKPLLNRANGVVVYISAH